MGRGADYERIIKTIEKGEQRIQRREEIMKSIAKKLDRYKNPWYEMRIQYGQNKGKYFTEECDRFILCQIHKLGYGEWDLLKAQFRACPLFRFDWFVKSRTAQELARRCDTLIRLVEKENQEVEERERQARKEHKKLLKGSSGKMGMPSGQRKSLPAGTGSGYVLTSSGRKRKQASMDNFVSASGGMKKKMK